MEVQLDCVAEGTPEPRYCTVIIYRGCPVKGILQSSDSVARMLCCCTTPSASESVWRI